MWAISCIPSAQRSQITVRLTPLGLLHPARSSRLLTSKPTWQLMRAYPQSPPNLSKPPCSGLVLSENVTSALCFSPVYMLQARRGTRYLARTRKGWMAYTKYFDAVASRPSSTQMRLVVLQISHWRLLAIHTLPNHLGLLSRLCRRLSISRRFGCAAEFVISTSEMLRTVFASLKFYTRPPRQETISKL